MKKLIQDQLDYHKFKMVDTDIFSSREPQFWVDYIGSIHLPDDKELSDFMMYKSSPTSYVLVAIVANEAGDKTDVELATIDIITSNYEWTSCNFLIDKITPL